MNFLNEFSFLNCLQHSYWTYIDLFYTFSVYQYKTTPIWWQKQIILDKYVQEPHKYYSPNCKVPISDELFQSLEIRLIIDTYEWCLHIMKIKVSWGSNGSRIWFSTKCYHILKTCVTFTSICPILTIHCGGHICISYK